MIDSNSVVVVVVSAPGRALAVGAGVVAAAGVAVALARRLRADRPPAACQWRRAGRLAELYCFPLKSGKPVAANTLQATETGLRQGALRDRCGTTLVFSYSVKVHYYLDLVNVVVCMPAGCSWPWDATAASCPGARTPACCWSPSPRSPHPPAPQTPPGKCSSSVVRTPTPPRSPWTPPLLRTPRARKYGQGLYRMNDVPC